MGDDDVTLREVGCGMCAHAVRCGRFHTMLLVNKEELRDVECEGTLSGWWRWLTASWGRMPKDGTGAEASQYEVVSPQGGETQ
jgi:hypothetical protein